MNFLFQKIKDITGKRFSKIKSKNREQQVSLEKKLVFSLNKSKIPNLKQFKYVGKYLSKKELLLIRFSFLVLFISVFFWVNNFYKNHLELVPIRGGIYREALVGSPKHINPLYSQINDVDNDISSLVYSSLFKQDKKNKLVKDLVDDYSVSEDAKVYTIKIKQNVIWHTGENLVVDDIIFTFETLKNEDYKSPLRFSFSGVNIEKVNDYELKFILTHSYSPFLSLLTFGIIPKKVWDQIPAEAMLLAELNLKPIGSGPYKFVNFSKNENGVIKEYDLEVNDNYYGNEPFIDLKFKFFHSFEEAIAALNDQQVDSLSYLPKGYFENIITPKTHSYLKLELPQVYSIYLNNSRVGEDNVPLSSKLVRQALAYSINRDEIINNILLADVNEQKTPFFTDSFAYDENVKKYDFNLEQARKLFVDDKWKLVNTEDEKNNNASSTDDVEVEKEDSEFDHGTWLKKDGKFLKLKFVSLDGDEERKTAEFVASTWEKIGVKVNLEFVAIEQISEIISLKDYDILLFLEIRNIIEDPYLFWHSSQIQEGMNYLGFMDGEVDKLLEEARSSSDENIRKEKYGKFQEIIMEESPIIYLYSKNYIYLQDKELKGFDGIKIFSPADRFLSINEWYLKTGKKLFW
ncbi:peptide ABC transporter substrate-binding protein [Candidatus Parcubacteria bacterium]|nr:peptide ABC transporter substrate-binding protein [Candidatus Parcubacteria bacterium]